MLPMRNASGYVRAAVSNAAATTTPATSRAARCLARASPSGCRCIRRADATPAPYGKLDLPTLLLYVCDSRRHAAALPGRKVAARAEPVCFRRRTGSQPGYALGYIQPGARGAFDPVLLLRCQRADLSGPLDPVARPHLRRDDLRRRD